MENLRYKFGIFKYGFTLAEVLITLVIIGIIAALTIPNVINNYSKQETVSRLKKAYSTIMQATVRAVADHGNVEMWEIGAAGNANDALTFFNKYMAPYLSLSEKAQKLSSTSWDKHYSHLNNSQRDYGDSYIRAYLSDGSSLTMVITNSTTSDKRIQVYVDINGDKKPNKLGRDIFIFWFFVRYKESSADYSGQFQPAGCMYSRTGMMSNSDGNCNKNQSGGRCGALIMKDGWQIKDDYPW